jgi:hypothetical protein
MKPGKTIHPGFLCQFLPDSLHLSFATMLLKRSIEPCQSLISYSTIYYSYPKIPEILMDPGTCIHPGFLRQLLSNPLNLGFVTSS